MRPPRLVAQIPPAGSSCLTGDFYIKSEGFSNGILHVSGALESFNNAPAGFNNALEGFNNALVSLNCARISFSNAEESFNSAL
jgi:hypothetical protein